jgi:hypothetical protein
VRHSTPIVVYSHIPMREVYKPWGWGTSDAEVAIKMLLPYGSVTVLNAGYIGAFYCLSLALQAIPMGVTYGIWRASALLSYR